jgi:hypothetical protein
MSGASAFQLLQRPQQQIQRHEVHLSPLQIAVVNLSFILHEHSHQLDDYQRHDNALIHLRELYHVHGDDFVKANFMSYLKQKYGEDPFKIIIEKLSGIFDFEFVPGYDDETQRHVVFKQGMGTNNFIVAMNSLQFLFNNRDKLPVMLPGCSLPPQVPNAWVQREAELMNDMEDELTAEEVISDSESGADLPIPLQYYKRLLKQGILKLRPLFDHARENPGSIVCYNEIKVLLVNALQKVEKWIKEQPKGRSPLRRSVRLQKKGGRKIKTVRRHNPNKHKKNKSRRG